MAWEAEIAQLPPADAYIESIRDKLSAMEVNKG